MSDPTHHYVFDDLGDLHILPIEKITAKQVRLKATDPKGRTRITKEEACYSKEEARSRKLLELDEKVMEFIRDMDSSRKAQVKLEENTYETHTFE